MQVIFHNSGKIDEYGQLKITRAGGEKLCSCKLGSPAGSMDGFFADACRDSCPHFGEPYQLDPEDNPTFMGLHLCNGTVLHFKEFIDERRKAQPWIDSATSCEPDFEVTP